MFSTLVALLMGHALADFALQSDAMAKGKNRNRVIDPATIPPGQKVQVCWPYWLAAHGLIHGLMVWLITGNMWLGIAESICHMTIDFWKCENAYGIHADQSMHLVCKLVWALC